MNTVTIQDRPVCFSCDTAIETNGEIVFAPPLCDHVDCASAVFHGICLMTWREKLSEERARYEERMRRHQEKQCGCFDEQGNLRGPV